MHKSIITEHLLILIIVCIVAVFYPRPLLIFPDAYAHSKEKEPEKAKKIAQAMIYRNDGKSMYRKITLLTCRFSQTNNGLKCISRPIRKTIENLSKDVGTDGRDTIELGIILEPSAERNMAFLQQDYEAQGKETDQWMYFPSMKKLKRIVSQSPNSPKTGSIFGSEISYEDNERMQLDDYTYSYKGEEKVDGRICDLIIARPTSQHYPKTSYSFRKIWTDRVSKFPLKTEYYDKKGALEKVSYLKKLEAVGSAYLARVQIMVSNKTGRMSMIRTDAAALDIPMERSLFQKRALEDVSFREPFMQRMRVAACE